MTLAYAILLVLFLVNAVLLVAFILAQQGKGAGMGASFGAGAANTLFGAAGSGNFFTKSTWVLAFTLFGICLALGYINNHRDHGNAAFDNIEEGVQTESAQVSQPAPVENSDSKAAVKVEKVEPPAAEKAAEKTVPEDNKNTASEASSDEKADQQ
ncbi:MAG: preprotein translocase subunit SecG [Succinimonas sp.]|nr:preprotein translocase subunit SecG [Succinimonas sp.]